MTTEVKIKGHSNGYVVQTESGWPPGIVCKNLDEVCGAVRKFLRRKEERVQDGSD